MQCEACQYSTENKKSFSNHTRYGCSGTSWKERNKESVAEYMKKYRDDNKEKAAEYNKAYQPAWRKRNPETVKKNRQKTRDKLRSDVLTAYGHKCKCCGEDKKEFLAIDHILGGGNQHRKSLHPNASAQTFYTWLRKNNYPKEFQVLCHNCNSAKEYYKICPHHRPFKFLISPHSDDAPLFAAYTIMREKLLVITVTHATMQGDNGNERAMEDYKAMKILGAPICFMGIDEDKLTEEILIEKFLPFAVNSEAWLPEEIEDGNPQHNLITKTLKKMFWKVHFYKTYSGLESRTIGKEVIPTPEELALKKRAMLCYQTQIQNPNTAHYFETYAEYQ